MNEPMFHLNLKPTFSSNGLSFVSLKEEETAILVKENELVVLMIEAIACYVKKKAIVTEN